MTHYLLLFLGGLAGSLHCVGMCGGFACALGGTGGGLVRPLLYNLGRVATYGFLGALAGQLGWLLAGPGGEAGAAVFAQRGFALLSGLLLVWVGVGYLGLLPRSSGSGAGATLFTQALHTLLRAPGPAAPLALGVANGFLPCPLVYAFAAQAAASGGAAPGLATMLAFGLGTFPAMLAMGGLGRRWRLKSQRLAGGLIVSLGLITLARGLLPWASHLHGL